MIDDADDKIRRNLVAASAAVLFLTYLGIPFDSLLGKFLDKPLTVHPAKLYATGLALIAYLAVRYRFSSAGESARSMHAETMRDFRELYLLKVATWAARRYTRTGERSAPLSPEAIKYIEDVSAEMSRDSRWAQGRPTLVVYPPPREPETGPWEFRWHFDLVWMKDGKKVASSTGRSTQFVPNLAWRAAIGLVSWGRAVTYSRVGVESHVPVFLAFAAILALSLKVAYGYFRSGPI